MIFCGILMKIFIRKGAMKREEAVTRIGKDKIIAVIREDKEDRTLNAAVACIEGGIKIIEITMNSAGAASVIKTVAEDYPHILVGAGTAISVDLAKQAIEAGARFVVSPHTEKEIIEYCHYQDVAACPGTSTPTEMMTADKYGADIIKVFPISQLGGYKYIKAMKGPLPHLKLMPTGGVDKSNIKQFIQADVFGVGLSGALVCREAVENGDYGMIKRLAQEIIKTVLKG